MSSKDYAVMPYSDYEGACEAIREKDGSSAPIKSGELRAKILGIETGADVSVVTAARADVREGKIFVNANGLPAEGTMPDVAQATPSISVSSGGLITASATQSEGYVASGRKSATKQLTTQAAKTVTPSTSLQTAVASGRYTTGAVKVAAVPTQTKTAIPSSSSQTIKPDSGKFLSQVTVNGDSNLVAENIKKGVSIFGVTGTHQGGVEIKTCNLRITDITPNGQETVGGPTLCGYYALCYENGQFVQKRLFDLNTDLESNTWYDSILIENIVSGSVVKVCWAAAPIVDVMAGYGGTVSMSYQTSNNVEMLPCESTNILLFVNGNNTTETVTVQYVEA